WDVPQARSPGWRANRRRRRGGRPSAAERTSRPRHRGRRHCRASYTARNRPQPSARLVGPAAVVAHHTVEGSAPPPLYARSKGAGILGRGSPLVKAGRVTSLGRSPSVGGTGGFARPVPRRLPGGLPLLFFLRSPLAPLLP